MPSERSHTPIAVFDLGGTWFRWGCYHPLHGLAECQRAPALNYLSLPDRSATELQQALTEFILSHTHQLRAAGHPEIRTVGVSIGAPVNAHDMTVLGSGPLWGESAQPFQLHAHLRAARPELRWYVVNDVTALLAPYMRDDVSHSKTLLITVSSGVGSRLYDHRTRRIPYDAQHGVQGEIGHLVATFELDSRQIDRHCECGGWNHLNAFASGRGIATTLHDLPSLAPDYCGFFNESVSAWRAAGDEHRLKSFAQALHRNDETAALLLDAFVTPLVRTLATALTLDPEIDRIIMTGGVVHGLAPYYKNALERTFLREELYQITARDPTYLTRRLRWEDPDDFSGLRGAGMYAASCHMEDRYVLSN